MSIEIHAAAVSTSFRRSGCFQIWTNFDPAIFLALSSGNGPYSLYYLSRRIVRNNDIELHLLNEIRHEPGTSKNHYPPLLTTMGNNIAFHKIFDTDFIKGTSHLFQFE